MGKKISTNTNEENIAELCNFHDFSQSTLNKMVAMVTGQVQT